MGIQRICIFRLGAVAMLKDFQHTAKDDSEAAIQALTAGVDLEASSNCYWALEQLIEQGRFDEKYVDLAVGRILRVKFELGLFENPYQGADMPGVAMRTKEAWSYRAEWLMNRLFY